jgi:hypothetical protein
MNRVKLRYVANVSGEQVFSVFLVKVSRVCGVNAIRVGGLRGRRKGERGYLLHPKIWQHGPFPYGLNDQEQYQNIYYNIKMHFGLVFVRVIKLDTNQRTKYIFKNECNTFVISLLS